MTLQPGFQLHHTDECDAECATKDRVAPLVEMKDGNGVVVPIETGSKNWLDFAAETLESMSSQVVALLPKLTLVFCCPKRFLEGREG